jgi:hypothetical protein
MHTLRFDLDMIVHPVDYVEIRAYFENHRGEPKENFSDVPAGCRIGANDDNTYDVGQNRE